MRLSPEAALVITARDRLGPAQRRDVVDERVDPDVDDMLGIAGDGDAQRTDFFIRDAEIGLRPPRTNDSTSLRRDSGRMKSGRSLYSFSR